MALAPLAHVLWTRVMTLRRLRPALGGPRPLRPVLRPRLGAPVLDAPPHRVRAQPRGPRGVPPVGLGHARPPRGAPHRRHRGHHRPPRPGVRQRRGPGPGRALAPGHLRRRGGRPPHLRHRLRRRPMEGISHEAASYAGHLGLGRLVVRLRRQPHLDRRRHRAAPTPTTCPPASGPTAGRCSTWARSANDLDALEGALLRGQGRRDPTHPRGGPQPRRPTRRRTTPTTPRPTATPSTPRRWPGPRRSWACPPTRRSTCPTTWPSCTTRPGAAAHRPTRPGRSASTPGTATRTPGPRPRPAPALGAWVDDLPTFEVGEQGGHPQGQRGLLPGPAGLGPRPPRRRRRPLRQHRHRDQGRRRPVRRRAGRPAAPLRHPRARHGGGDERHGPPRRRASRSGGTFMQFSDYCDRRSAWRP